MYTCQSEHISESSKLLFVYITCSKQNVMLKIKLFKLFFKVIYIKTKLILTQYIELNNVRYRYIR